MGIVVGVCKKLHLIITPTLIFMVWLGYLNDLWRYRMNDSTWTWIGGSDTINQPGVHGEKGISNTSYVPNSRYSAVGWYDSSRQEFRLLGGELSIFYSQYARRSAFCLSLQSYTLYK